jgi:hypothetical protein
MMIFNGQSLAVRLTEMEAQEHPAGVSARERPFLFAMPSQPSGYVLGWVYLISLQYTSLMVALANDGEQVGIWLVKLSGVVLHQIKIVFSAMLRPQASLTGSRVISTLHHAVKIANIYYRRVEFPGTVKVL